jgi:hypothetical protein
MLRQNAPQAVESSTGLKWYHSRTERTKAAARQPADERDAARQWINEASDRYPEKQPLNHPLYLRDGFGLQALRALLDLELHKLALGKRFVSLHLNRGEMDENIFPRLALNEAISLGSVEPLHHTLFSSQRSDSSSRNVPIQVFVTPVGSTEGPR